MINNIVLLPILIPFLGSIMLLLLPKKIIVQRIAALCFGILLLFGSGFLVYYVHVHGIQVVNLGSWKAPFGISIVADMLAALLTFTTSLLVTVVIFYSFYSIGKPRERFLYYPMILFMIVGVNGSFLTGDIFNMFVFFEVMLMASYVLLVIGGTEIQLKATIKYLLINVIGSAFFVVAVGLLYSMIGSLNMADISQKISTLGDHSYGMLSVVGVLFLFVFGLKAGVFPLYFWLPGSYFAPPMPILALFGGLLTKVGVYAIIRTFSLFFHQETSFVMPLLSILALLTIVLGIIGAISYYDMKTVLIYNIMIAIGVILYSVSLMTRESLNGAIFYLFHDMIIKTALFLIVGTIIAITGYSSTKRFSGLMSVKPALSWAFFIGTLGLAGIPPLSGFIGKIFIVEGAFDSQHFVGGTIVLVSSLFVLFSMIKLFTKGIWGVKEGTFNLQVSYKRMMIPIVVLLALSLSYGIFTDAIYPFIKQAVDPLIDPTIYIHAVLGE
ncbi:Mrp complex subunit D1 [Listeria grayi]|uniref:Monovalent cation/H+ antiporter subunit D n=2 Tax=Listeria grayi TaxID=1641 RepID=A0A829R533_LISGR|nr:Na+/H+ antiporter subunit D [Listeria grayi]EUJ25921.1 monovalent cation/H+ antiporter subunit D [Listeria grayi FSL F6-1183]STY44240.1 Mrp complex subunit D1 [Listeria grayi]VEI36013.1 Mrp complex subunit D1 [Listeria grayi]